MSQETNGEGKLDPSVYADLDKQDPLDTVSWYLVVIGLVALGFAALCLLLDHTGNREFFSHKDFALNPVALARKLLIVAAVAYAAGRGIKYYQRFRKRD